jgi:hypothetical protein
MVDFVNIIHVENGVIYIMDGCIKKIIINDNPIIDQGEKKRPIRKPVQNIIFERNDSSNRNKF